MLVVRTMKTPSFSVVTIFLNAERFLDEAVQSVLNQDYSDWELLLVDDGSTDKSRELAQRYAAGHPKIRYLEHAGHENQGMGPSRNLGLQHARGQYLVCLDSDDVLLPGSLRIHAGMLTDHPEAAMAYGSADWWNSWENSGQSDWADGVGGKVARPNSLVHPPTLATLMLRDGGAIPCWCAVAFRTEVVRQLGGFDTYVRDGLRDLYEDQVIQSKIFLERPVYVTDAVLGRYRQHSDQVCAQADIQTQAAARIRFLEWLTAYSEERGIHNDQFRAALSDASSALARSRNPAVWFSPPHTRSSQQPIGE